MPPLRFAIYARYSSELQDGENSIARQLAACRAWAKANGYQESKDAVFLDEGISGATISARPGLQKLLSELKASRKASWDAVLVDDASRLDRGGALAQLAQAFAARGVRLIAVDSGRDLTDENETLLLHVTAGLSAHYLAELARRTRAGMAQKAARGLWTGGSCFGYRMVKEEGGTRVEVDPEQAAVVRRIFGGYETGEGLAAIAKALNRDRAPSPRGGLWAQSAIRAILRNPRYIGEWRWQTSRWKRRPDGLGEGATGRQRLFRPASEHVALSRPELAIVDRECWNSVRARFEANAGRPQRSPELGPLAGLLVCGECGKAITRSGGAANARYLACAHRRARGPLACGNFLAQREAMIVGAVTSYIAEEVLSAAAVRETLTEIRRWVAASTKPKRRGDADSIRREMAKLQKERKRLTDLLASGESIEAIREALRERDEALERSRAQLAMAERPDQPVPRLVPDSEALEAASRLRARLLEGGEGAREIIRSVVSRVIVHPFAGNWEKGWTLEIETRAPISMPAYPIHGSGGALCPISKGKVRARR